MAEYKLITALATDLPGNTMMCYGKLCNIKNDGVYTELTSEEAKIYLKAGRIAPVAEIVDDVVPVTEPEVVEEPEAVTEPEVVKKPEATEKKSSKESDKDLSDLLDSFD